MNINKKNILTYADAYDNQYRGTDGEKVEIKMKCLLKKQRFLKQKELVEIGMWKSRRPKKHYESVENDDMTVREITKFSFNAKSEKARVKSLLALKGASWPVASAILHFAFPNMYPIMDFRVLGSLWGMKKPIHYDFILWERYCNKVRDYAEKYSLPIRTVEKALWKYDELKLGKRKTCKQKE